MKQLDLVVKEGHDIGIAVSFRVVYQLDIAGIPIKRESVNDLFTFTTILVKCRKTGGKFSK